MQVIFLLYLCTVFNERKLLIVLFIKITKEMKKLVLALAVIASVSMISCTNNAEQATETAAEETVEAVEATADTVAAVVDSAATVAEEAAAPAEEAPAEEPAK